MTWRDTLSNLVKKPATHWFYESIPPKNTSMEDVVSPIEPNKAYVRVKLIQMYLGLRRIWTMNRMPVVHAFPRFLQSQGTVDVPVIIAPNRLKDLDGSHTERVVSLNQTVFGPVPYIGGDLDLLMGLFAAETKNYADQFFNLLGSISEALPNAELKMAVTFAKTMEKGLEDLAGLKELTLQVGVQDTFSCPVPGQDLTNPLSSGYRALIAKDEKDFDPKDLWLDERGLHIKANGNPGNLLTGCDYLVFKIEKIPPPRDDWRVLQSLNAAWKKVEDTVSSCEGDKAAVDRAFNMFKWMVLGCGDLLVSDRKRIVAQQSDALATLWNAGTETHFGPLEVAPEIKELYKKDTIDAANIQVRLD